MSTHPRLKASYRPRRAGALLALGALLLASCAQLRDLPILKDSDIRGISLAQSSKIYAGNGSLLTTLHGIENRTSIAFSRIPKTVKDAIIAIEDERFYKHDGVDVRAIFRALVANVTSCVIDEGCS